MAETNREEELKKIFEEAKAEAEAPEAEEAEAMQEAGGGPQQDAEDTAAEEAPEGEVKKGLFKKKEKKKDKKDEQIEELTDRLKRQMAEFENFRKRTDKEKSQMYDMGVKSIIEKVLPVIDNFERGLLAVSEEEKENAFVDGMNKIYRQMMTTLEEIGVRTIEAAGAEFNPDFHNAVMHIEDESVGENMIVEELQKGYLYHDVVVRHSMVKVAN